jgi:hypothetical protein
MNASEWPKLLVPKGMVRISLLGMTERKLEYISFPRKNDCFYAGIKFRGHVIEYHNAYVYPADNGI